MTHLVEALERALEAAARCHAVLDMGRGNVAEHDRTAARYIVQAFVEALPDQGQGLGMSASSTGVCVTLPRIHEVQSLAEAMWQLLDDMGPNGTSVCPAAKAQARVAFEPWRSPDMPLDTSVNDARVLLHLVQHGPHAAGMLRLIRHEPRVREGDHGR